MCVRYALHQERVHIKDAVVHPDTPSVTYDLTEEAADHPDHKGPRPTPQA
jgi:hypothetical protein